MQWSLKLFMVDSLLGKKLIIVYVKTFWTYKKIKSLQKGGSFGIMTHSLNAPWKWPLIRSHFLRATKAHQVTLSC